MFTKRGCYLIRCVLLKSKTYYRFNYEPFRDNKGIFVNKLLILLFLSYLLGCAGERIPTNKLITLEFYPECDYRVIDTIRASNEEQHEALYHLKKSAIVTGADAIAITHFKKYETTGKTIRGEDTLSYKYSYKAEAIELCSTPPQIPYNTANNTPVQFNEAGSLVLIDIPITFKTEITFGGIGAPEEKFVPELSTNKIDSQGSIFGLSLGITKEKLLEALGAPSVIISESESKHIFQYGRRHLFYIANDHFVAYEFSDWFLPPHINNKVSFHEQFDDLKLIVDNEISLKSTLKETRAFYGEGLAKVSQGNFSLRDNKNDVNFVFRKKIDLVSGNEIRKLASFSIREKGIYFKTWRQIIANNKFNRTIDIGQMKLPIFPHDSRKQVQEKLGSPKAAITDTRGKLTWIYDDELSVIFYKYDVFKYSFEESTNREKMAACESCVYLGQKKSLLPVKYLKINTDFEYVLENNGVTFSLGFTNVEGVNYVNKITVESQKVKEQES